MGESMLAELQVRRGASDGLLDVEGGPSSSKLYLQRTSCSPSELVAYKYL